MSNRALVHLIVKSTIYVKYISKQIQFAEYYTVFLPVDHSIAAPPEETHFVAPNLKACLSTVQDVYPECEQSYQYTLRKKSTIHQVTTILATSKNALFPGHNHL